MNPGTHGGRIGIRWPAAPALYLVLAVVITVGAGLPATLSTHQGLVNGPHPAAGVLRWPDSVVLGLLLLSAYGPALAAIIVCALLGQGRVRALLAQLGRWRAGAWWYAAALLGPSLLTAVALGIMLLAGRAGPGPWLYAPAVLRLGLLALGPWGEELGWRGFLQPYLQARVHPLLAASLVAVCWFVWHQWPLLTPVGADLRPIGLVTFFAYLLAVSVLIAWLYNRTGGSLPVAWAAHAGMNLGLVATPSVPLARACFVAAALVVAWRDPRLGTRPEPGQRLDPPRSGPIEIAR